MTSYEQTLTVTPEATNAIRDLLSQHGYPDYALRVFVKGIACSGQVMYGMGIDDTTRQDDTVIKAEDIKVVIDAHSLEFMQGSIIEFLDGPNGGAFRINNPNTITSACQQNPNTCGQSCT